MGLFKVPTLTGILLTVGIVFRLYLAFSLPLWHDEASSIWVSRLSVVDILKGAAEPVHLPGYFFFLKLWSLDSDHLFWLRLSSLFFFLINIWLLGLIGQRKKDKHFALILIFVYLFSGYFVIFDWQLRMYTGVLTFILASMFFLMKRKIFFFTLINALGLYFDYGFFWYFAPLSLWLFFKRPRPLFFSISVSVSLFALWLPLGVRHFNRGVAGIEWMKSFLSPAFFLPYFLGTHVNYFFTLLFFILVFLGLWAFWRQKEKSQEGGIILFCSGFSLFSSLLFSALFFPVFHLRSLQIVGLAVVFLLALALDWLWRQKKHLAVIVFFLMMVNFFLVVRIHLVEPGELLVNFFPGCEFVPDHLLDIYDCR